MPFNLLQQGREQDGKNHVLGTNESNVDSPSPGKKLQCQSPALGKNKIKKFFFPFLSMHLITQKIIKVYAVMSVIGKACKSTAVWDI